VTKSSGTIPVERQRLIDARSGRDAWKRWGPYLSERQWGTVREDYSEDGNAWDYFSHDHARSRAYRWGEDGIGGISDDKQRLCFALALWNGADPILKERLFGLTNSEGNHGEDVKEYYYYLDSTPTHSYMKFLYRYPQRAYPYDDLVATNKARSRNEMEYELLETGVFDDNRYFDVFVEYAKAAPDDILIRITAENRGTEAATLHVLPTLWFRNTWSWDNGGVRPSLAASGGAAIGATHPDLGACTLHCEGAPELLFTENETNNERIDRTPNRTRYVKDAFHRLLVHGDSRAVNPDLKGTKAAAHYRCTIQGGSSAVIRLRLVGSAARAGRQGARASAFGAGFEKVFAGRRQEADEFYASLTPHGVTPDAAQVMRQGFAGMLWSKQYYYFDVDIWLRQHGVNPLVSKQDRALRNRQWFHMFNDDIISMPDKWEYPWYAAWDLAFHAIALAAVDPDFAKEQLQLMLRETYLHPNGQIPAYEWNFGDVNPPVHAWAAYYVYQIDREVNGVPDRKFLEITLQKLLLNFTWWVNRKDVSGNNVFQGGFLGLDNIGVFDRSAPLPTGGHLEQSDGTAWMAFFSQCMLQMSVELAQHDPVYENLAVKFFEHFVWIASAMDRVGDIDDEVWDEADGFFYDVLKLPDEGATRLKVRSLVGLLPLAASTVFSSESLAHLALFRANVSRFMQRHPELLARIALPDQPGPTGRHLLAVLDEQKLRRMLARMLDEKEFMSPYGIRSLSKYHEAHPYVFRVGKTEYRVAYEPAESASGMFGGNSNWRGPVWMPMNLLLIRGVMQLYRYYGDGFTVECPTGSGNQMTLLQVARELSRRLSGIFLREPDGRRPVFGDAKKFQEDPNWKDHLLFYEYFHGDNGAGIGASHQTGWTGIIGALIQLEAVLTPQGVLKDEAFTMARRAGKGRGKRP